MFAALAVIAALLWSSMLIKGHLEARNTVLDRLEASLLDLRVLAFGARKAPQDVVIVAIDDATVRQEKSFPLPRRVLAEAIAKLVSAGAKAVAIDALFLESVSPEGDDALGQALASGPTAVAAMISFPPDDTDRDKGPPTCDRPVASIGGKTSIGLVNILLDASGEARHVPMLLPCQAGFLPALALRTVSLAMQAEPAFDRDGVTVGGQRTPLDAGRNLALRYYGPEATIRTVGVSDVLATGTAEFARNKTVVLGATATGVGDRHPTPFDVVLPGVEIVATAIGNLQTGDALVRTTLVRRLDSGMAMLMVCAVVALLSVETIGWGLLGLVGLLLVWLLVVLVGFAHGVWFSMALPLAAIAPPAVWTAAGRLALDRMTERRLQRSQTALSVFQPPAMLMRLAQDPDFLATPVERTVAVVFIDLSGFTGLSERLGAKATRDLLKEWHEIVATGAADGGGFVASYMADGAMLVWGMTEGSADDALSAVRAALHLRKATLHWLRTIEARVGLLGVKVGGHTGTASLSRLGHASHQHFTAIGDTVNIASRLMDVAAESASTMALSAQLLSDAKARGLTEREASFTSPIHARIRGREQALPVCLFISAPP